MRRQCSIASIRRRDSRTRLAGWLGCLAAAACLAVQPAHAQNTWLTIKFDTSHLGTFPTVSGSGYGVWSNGLTVSDTNTYASFEWTNNALPAASGTNPDGTPKQHTNFSAVINGQTLTWTSTSSWSGGAPGFSPTLGNWYVNGTAATSSIMSPAYTISTMNAGEGTRANLVLGNNLYIEYGQNTIGGGPPPSTAVPTTRFATVEFTYEQGKSTNNLDFTAINTIGAAVRATFQGATGTTSLGFTGYTSDLLPQLGAAVAAANLASGTTPSGLVSNGGGNYVATVLSTAQPPGGGQSNTNTAFLAGYPAYIASVLSGTVESVKSPLMTNQPGGSNPTPAQLVQAPGFTGPTREGGSGDTWQVASFFAPTFMTSISDTTYSITFTGSITAVQPGYNGTTINQIKTYGTGSAPLTITIDSGSSFYGYLSNGNVNLSTVTLSGSDWATFSTDFFQGGGGPQAGPSAAIASGSTSNDSAVYGQVVQRAIGDLQELLMIGVYGNTSVVQFSGSSVILGSLPSQNVWSDKAYAYANTGTAGFNPIGKYIWENSSSTDAAGVSTAGAVYSNPYDDRFSGGVSIGLDSQGGTLTIGLREINPVPEPSSMALLAIGGASLGGLAWRRRRQARPVSGPAAQ
jgi:hypothetical protein